MDLFKNSDACFYGIKDFSFSLGFFHWRTKLAWKCINEERENEKKKLQLVFALINVFLFFLHCRTKNNTMPYFSFMWWRRNLFLLSGKHKYTGMLLTTNTQVMMQCFKKLFESCKVHLLLKFSTFQFSENISFNICLSILTHRIFRDLGFFGT